MRRSLPILLLASIAAASAGAQDPARIVDGIISSAKFKRASSFLERDYEQLVSELIAITEIPAPPFKEQERAAFYLGLLKRAGLADVEMDPEGNVMGLRRGTGSGRILAVVAHLDTVFPAGTNVTVRREGTRLTAPGVGDDALGLAVMLSAIRGLEAGDFRTSDDVLFVGGVGEEGEGDLRGVKYLLQKGKHRDKISQFVAIDGPSPERIATGALASQRVRVTFTGPGGHSYGAFGIVSPSLAMGKAIEKLSRVSVPSTPKTTFNVGVVGGGTSVNAIPAEVYMSVDLRSESRDELRKLVERFQAIVQEAVDEENGSRSTAEGSVRARIDLIGDRPGGHTPVTSEIVQRTTAVVRAFGLQPYYVISSTDANIPISMGIPAVTIGTVQRQDRAHSLDEWVDVDKGSTVETVQIAMTTILALSGGR
jgi:acetylornithine deacetylase/succinyl-diaminopimelate desuccinylase-like protein